MSSPDALALAQPVLDAFHEAVVRCGRAPAFKPRIELATAPGPTRYDHAARAVILVPYDLLDPGRRAGMERFAAIGGLGLSGRAQYEEVFNRLLVAHELGHWVQELARAPLTRWQAEYGANRMMVAFWRDHPAPGPDTERRLANFTAQPPGSRLPAEAEADPEAYFNRCFHDLLARPMDYALFQKRMVRQAMAETPAPSFRQTIQDAWPL